MTTKDKTVSIRGKVAYWTLSNETNLESLREGLEAVNLGQYTPDEVSPQIALKNAVVKVCGGRRRMVRPLSDRQGYAVVSESQKDNSGKGASLAHEVDYHAVFTQDGAGISFENPDGTKADAATVVAGTGNTPVETAEFVLEAERINLAAVERDRWLNPEPAEAHASSIADAGARVAAAVEALERAKASAVAETTYGTEWYVIREKFAEELDKCPAHKVAQALVKIVDWLHGVPLRPTGGIYWLPESVMDRWTGVVKAVQDAGSRNTVYGLRTAMDEDATTAIHAALIHSIESEIEKHTIEFRDNPPKRESTYKYRQNRIEKLANRVAGYANILGKDLSTLQEQLDTLEGARAMAALAAMRPTI